MVTKTKKTKKIVKSAAKRGVKSTARTAKRPVKKVVAKTVVKRAKKVVAKSVAKRLKKPAVRYGLKLTAEPVSTTTLEVRPEYRPVQEIAKSSAVGAVVIKPKPKTIRQAQSVLASAEARRTLRMARMPQFAYMKPPGAEHAYEVGNTVEVFCDHEKNNDRIRGWVKGIVVQVDNKLVAVQFRSNVYLTDGWMVPDHILWYPITSDQIRAETFNKKGSTKKDIPDY